MKSLSNFEKFTFLFLLIIFGYGIFLSKTNIIYFEEVFTIEESLVEYTTVLFLSASCILLIYRFIKLYKYKNIYWKLGTLSLSFLFFFAAGEEISWGQHLFSIKPSNFFLQNNAQKETNFHNLILYKTNLNKLIFSQILTGILILYLLILPFLIQKFKSVYKLANKFAIPIVKCQYTIAFLISTILLVFINSIKKWELYELAFATIFFVIFLNPKNKEIYQKEV